MGTRCADHVTPLYPQKLALTSPTGGGRSVVIVRSRTKATESSLRRVEVTDIGNMVIHSLRILSCGRSIVSSKASSAHSRSSASSFNWQYLSFSLRSSSHCLHLLRRLPVFSIFPSKACFKRQFLRKMWPIQFAFLLFIVRGIFLSSLTVCYTSSFLTRSVQLIFAILLQHHIPKLHKCLC